MGIGQGQISVTPLQLACAYATLLRGGDAMAPRLVVDEKRAAAHSLDIPPEHLAAVRQGMELVVAGDHGTARKELRMRVPVAGKTGSSEDKQPAFDAAGEPIYDPERPVVDAHGQAVLGPDGQPAFHQASVKGTDAWFAGYVPANDPKFVIVAVMEFGGHGGTQATPLVKEAILALERHKYLPGLDLR